MSNEKIKGLALIPDLHDKRKSGALPFVKSGINKNGDILDVKYIKSFSEFKLLKQIKKYDFVFVHGTWGTNFSKLKYQLNNKVVQYAKASNKTIVNLETATLSRAYYKGSGSNKLHRFGSLAL